MFGEDVAALVAEVTDDKSLDEGVRKRLQVEQAPHKSARAKILKLADKISNVHAIAVSPPANWPRERRRDYIRWGREVVAGLAGASPALEQKFQRVADDADKANRGDGS
jgi:(p)ppGpp synthase/HD superfamily hydrolase